MTKAMRQFTRARVLLQQRPLTIACAVGAVVLYLALRKPAARAVEADDDAAPPCDVLTNPAWAPRLSTLAELSLAGCGLTELPETIGACVSLKKLDLAKNDLADLPSSLENLKKLEILFVLGNRRMTKVPAVLARVASLTRLGLRSNGLTALEGARLPPHLVHVIFTDNFIATIDEKAYEKFGTVRKLMLANNRLTTFDGGKDPTKNLRSLELLRLSNNDLEGLPATVLASPRLSWLALAGNPRLVGAPPPGAPLPVVRLEDIDFSGAEALGKGASGTVKSAVWRGAPCAVKQLLVKSSDGTAKDEMATLQALGSPEAAPPSLIKAIAVVEDPPAVVMERVEGDARDLAKPPTIVEVTRDRYAPGERFAATFALDALRGVAAALRHVHARRVAHGDVYGHNVLVAGGSVRLGDFGAASYYGNFDETAARLLERVEVRAFGVLCAELGTRVVGDAALRDALTALADAALDPDVSGRPGFGDVVARLAALEVVA